MLDFINRIEGEKVHRVLGKEKKDKPEGRVQTGIIVQCNLEKDKGTGSKEHLHIGIGSLNMLGAHTLAGVRGKGADKMITSSFFCCDIACSSSK